MAEAEADAKAKGFRSLSLVVFEQNKVAYELYQQLGYREIKREPIVAHALIHYTGDALLMIKDLTAA